MEKIFGISVHTESLQDQMGYDGVILLTYKIDYPQFVSDRFSAAAARLNLYYKAHALAFERYCRKRLFQTAVEQYEFDKGQGYPAMTYEAETAFEVTYNQNCAVSLRLDRYLFSGGAHGSTHRYGDTWDLKTGRRMNLEQFFARGIDVKQYVVRQVTEQIEKQIQNGENYYFDNYEQNVADELNLEDFYLVPQGVMIFFQQYAIAPYSSGMPEFLLPFIRGISMPPHC